MNAIKQQLIEYLDLLPSEKMQSVLDYACFLKNQPTPLDDYDYELLKSAETLTADELETISIEQASAQAGIDYEAL